MTTGLTKDAQPNPGTAAFGLRSAAQPTSYRTIPISDSFLREVRRPMGLFSKPNWALCVVKENKAIYSMNGDSVMSIIGYLMPSFKDGSEPVAPWGLYLMSNKTKNGFYIHSKHITPDGDNLTEAFYEELNIIDPAWSERRGESISAPDPICYEIKTGKRLKIWDDRPFEEMFSDAMARTHGVPTQEEETFLSAVSKIFGKD